jgi:hypothetical protein
LNQFTFQTEFVQAIVTSGSGVENWCMVNYGQPPKVYIGMDEDNLPGEKDCPCIEIHIPGKITGSALSEKEYWFVVICTIHDDTTQNVIPTVFEHSGIANIEALRLLVQSMFTETLPGNANVAKMEVQHADESEFPFFQVGMLFTVTENQILGQDPYE